MTISNRIIVKSLSMYTTCKLYMVPLMIYRIYIYTLFLVP
jgi:hypothetical protein